MRGKCIHCNLIWEWESYGPGKLLQSAHCPLCNFALARTTRQAKGEVRRKPEPTFCATVHSTAYDGRKAKSVRCTQYTQAVGL